MSAARSRPGGALKRLMARRSPIAREKATRRRFLESAESFTPYVVAERREGTFVLPVHGAAEALRQPAANRIRRARTGAADAGGARRLERGAGRSSTSGQISERRSCRRWSFMAFERGVAIEPDPENRKVLRASLALNEVDDRVEVVAAASVLGPRRGDFTRQRWGGGKHRIGSGRLSDDPAQASDLISVETVSLDDLAAQGVIDADTVSLLWLDVQGHEGEVLEGASSLLRRRVPVVFALRPRELSRPGILAELLGRHYDTLVDLRHPS